MTPVKFDPNFSPNHETNRRAAAARGLRYDHRRRVYVDADGCPALDKFGQPLG
jgi:hypothetical protein